MLALTERGKVRLGEAWHSLLVDEDVRAFMA
jgi:hypothetical protein